jgi:hypothetical protein
MPPCDRDDRRHNATNVPKRLSLSPLRRMRASA